MRRRKTPYERAGRWALKKHRGKTDIFLVHGRVQHPKTGKRVPHAWVEFAAVSKVKRLLSTMDDGSKRKVRVLASIVYDRSLPKKYRKSHRDDYYRIMKPTQVHRYGRDQVTKLLASHRHWGPWA